MDDFVIPEFCYQEFSGHVPVLPLPEFVLFPHVLQPIHITRPEHQKLIADIACGDALLAICPCAAEARSLLVDSQKSVFGQSGGIGCLGQLLAWRRLPAGGINALVAGRSRIRIIDDFASAKPYLQARAELCPDHYPDDLDCYREVCLKEIRRLLLYTLADELAENDQWDEILSGEACLGTITDVVSHVLDLSCRQKLQLLAETNVKTRTILLLEYLQQRVVNTLSLQRQFEGVQFELN